MLMKIAADHWHTTFPESTQLQAIQQLEEGQILFFPTLPFKLLPEEEQFLSDHYIDPHTKNVSYQQDRHKLWGVQHLSDPQHLQLKSFLDRYCTYAAQLLKALLPRYIPQLTVARTSFRPVQISNRKTSFRKDDKRLHVDAFPSAPNQGKRILRVFTNINPHGEDRVWRVGEPFSRVAEHFVSQIQQPIPGFSHLLRLLRITKSYRTAYDHYMLHLHDKMKCDEEYQRTAAQEEIHFPAGSTWIVQTDHVSHAAMQGQYVLEQTFYLPVKAMQNQNHSPLRILEKQLAKQLV